MSDIIDAEEFNNENKFPIYFNNDINPQKSIKCLNDNLNPITCQNNQQIIEIIPQDIEVNNIQMSIPSLPQQSMQNQQDIGQEHRLSSKSLDKMREEHKKKKQDEIKGANNGGSDEGSLVSCCIIEISKMIIKQLMKLNRKLCCCLYRKSKKIIQNNNNNKDIPNLDNDNVSCHSCCSCPSCGSCGSYGSCGSGGSC